MLTEPERQERIAKIREFPKTLGDAVKGLTDQQLDTLSAEGEWTVRQIAHHMVDACLNQFVRMRLVLTEEKPILKPFGQDEWARLPDSLRGPLAPSFSILKGLCQRWRELLKSVSGPAWERWGMHLEAGKLTVDDILAGAARHLEEHLAQIQGLRKKMGW